jgi:hypothetical protein
MIWISLIQYITETRIKHAEYSTQTHKVYPQIFDVCSISDPADVDAIFELF